MYTKYSCFQKSKKSKKSIKNHKNTKKCKVMYRDIWGEGGVTFPKGIHIPTISPIQSYVWDSICTNQIKNRMKIDSTKIFQS